MVAGRHAHRHRAWHEHLDDEDGRLRAATVLAGTGGTAFRAPSWTPDGTRILATREAGGTRTVIVATADGKDQRDLASGSGGAVSADGLRVLTVSATGRLIGVTFQGLQPHPLSPDGETAAFPAWSP